MRKEHDFSRAKRAHEVPHLRQLHEEMKGNPALPSGLITAHLPFSKPEPRQPAAITKR